MLLLFSVAMLMLVVVYSLNISRTALLSRISRHSIHFLVSSWIRRWSVCNDGTIESQSHTLCTQFITGQHKEDTRTVVSVAFSCGSNTLSVFREIFSGTLFCIGVGVDLVLARIWWSPCHCPTLWSLHCNSSFDAHLCWCSGMSRRVVQFNSNTILHVPNVLD